MPNLLVAGNSSNGGTAISTDTSGTLNIVTGSGSGATAISVDASQATTFSAGVSGTTGSFSGNLSFNSGYGSAAVAYGCRAWVNFNGTGTVAIRASGNVTSITDNGTGDYTVNITTALSDANYAIAFGAVSQSITNNTASQISIYGAIGTGANTKTTTALRIVCGSSASGALQDHAEVNVSIFR
jgi:hypothetical protein